MREKELRRLLTLFRSIGKSVTPLVMVGLVAFGNPLLANAEANRDTPVVPKAPEPAATPSPSVEFRTLPPGSRLPSAADCAANVSRSGWEPRPQNAAANQTKGSSGAKIDGADASFNARYASRIDGDFVGTTDEIIQWGA